MPVFYFVGLEPERVWKMEYLNVKSRVDYLIHHLAHLFANHIKSLGYAIGNVLKKELEATLFKFIATKLKGESTIGVKGWDLLINTMLLVLLKRFQLYLKMKIKRRTKARLTTSRLRSSQCQFQSLVIW